MDKRKGTLNVVVSIAFHILTMVTAVLVKRVLIQTCGNEINGLNTLYLNIVGFLSVAELGIGSAISFSMYKPIVEGNTAYVSALYRLFQRVYLIIGSIIWILGLGLTPFITVFTNGYNQVNVDLHFTFMLMLLSVAVTYWYGPKISLINAYKNNYIATSITSCGTIFQSLLQIVALLVTQSFVWYLVCRIVATLCQGLVAQYVAKKHHNDILSLKQSTSILNKREITKNIKAMFMHKVGGLLATTLDGIVISAYIGLNTLGKYSNYNTILLAVTNLVMLVFSSLTSVLGHLYVESGKEVTKRYSDAFHLLNFVMGVIVYLGYYAIINNLITILFAENLLMDKLTVFVVTFNGFVFFMRRSTLLFRDATGTFYHDRWTPIAEGVVNVILSIIFVQWLGVAGVIVATVITTLLICHVVEPLMLYKHAFETSPAPYFLRNFGMIALFFVALVGLDFCMQNTGNEWLTLLVNGCISVGISLLVCGVVLLFAKEERSLIFTKLLRRK